MVMALKIKDTMFKENVLGAMIEEYDLSKSLKPLKARVRVFTTRGAIRTDEMSFKEAREFSWKINDMVLERPIRA